jgi:predicted dehydrogenase
MTNTGVHYIDLIHWTLGETAPTRIAALGGKFGDFDNREIPDTMEAIFTYASGTLVTFSQYNASSAPASARQCEIEFRGTKGTIYYRGDGFEVVPETPPAREFPILSPLDRAGARGWREGKALIEAKEVKPASTGDVTIAHARNFLDCIKSRARCNADIETGHRSTTATQLANVSLRTGAMLDWDATTERFRNNDRANELLSVPYRAPYELPAV